MGARATRNSTYANDATSTPAAASGTHVHGDVQPCTSLFTTP